MGCFSPAFASPQDNFKLIGGSEGKNSLADGRGPVLPSTERETSLCTDSQGGIFFFCWGGWHGRKLEKYIIYSSEVRSWDFCGGETEKKDSLATERWRFCFFGLEEMGLNLPFSNTRGVHFLCLERYHDTIDDTQTPSAII